MEILRTVQKRKTKKNITESKEVFRKKLKRKLQKGRPDSTEPLQPQSDSGE